MGFTGAWDPHWGLELLEEQRPEPPVVAEAEDARLRRGRSGSTRSSRRASRSWTRPSARQLYAEWVEHRVRAAAGDLPGGAGAGGRDPATSSATSSRRRTRCGSSRRCTTRRRCSCSNARAAANRRDGQSDRTATSRSESRPSRRPRHDRIHHPATDLRRRAHLPVRRSCRSRSSRRRRATAGRRRLRPAPQQGLPRRSRSACSASTATPCGNTSTGSASRRLFDGDERRGLLQGNLGDQLPVQAAGRPR